MLHPQAKICTECSANDSHCTSKNRLTTTLQCHLEASFRPSSNNSRRSRSTSFPPPPRKLPIHQNLGERIVQHQIRNRAGAQSPAERPRAVHPRSHANTPRDTRQLLGSGPRCAPVQLQISPGAVLTQKNRTHIPHNAQLTQLTLLLRLKIATRIHVRRDRSTKSAHTKNSEVNILLGMQILLHATLTPHGGLGVRIVKERGNREVNRLRIVSAHQLPQQRTQVRNTGMVSVTGTVQLNHRHAGKRAARQMTRNLSHGRTPRHTQARSIINQGVK